MNVAPRQLRIFLSLAETLNFSRTAERFGLTQPSLSKIVRELELDLGVALFRRTTRSVALTDEGAALVAPAQRLIQDFDQGLAEIGGVARRYANRISIAALPSLAAMVLPAVGLALRADTPDLQMAVFDVLSDPAIELLLERKADFALTSVDPADDRLSFQEILRDSMVLLARADDPIAKRKAAPSLVEALELDLISMPKSSAARQYAEAGYLARGVTFKPRMEFEHLATIGKFVRAGYGVALLPCLAALMIQESDLAIVGLKDANVRSLGVIVRRGETLTPLAHRAIALVGEEAASLIARAPKWLAPPALRSPPY